MNMKKLLFLPLLALSINTYSRYTPTQGPLTLIDPIGQIGAITATLRNNPELQAEAIHITNFVQNIHMGPMPYERIIDHIILAQTPQALLALEAYGKTIMYMYQKQAYVLKAGFAPHCFPIRGIKNPFPNQAELDQLLEEYDQLATIAMKKSYLVGSRMKLTVKAYKHWYWKTCAAIAAGVYLLYDIGQRDQKDTILYGLCRMNLKPIFKNIATDLYAKTDNADRSSTCPDMPRSPEKAIIDLMAASEASRDKLLCKEILSVVSYKKAIEAQQQAKIAARQAVAAQEEVLKLQNVLSDQEINAQKTLEAFYQQKNPEIVEVARVQERRPENPPALPQKLLVPENFQINSNSICEQIMSIPAAIKTNGYNCIKTLIDTYIDPASPNAILR